MRKIVRPVLVTFILIVAGIVAWKFIRKHSSGLGGDAQAAQMLAVLGNPASVTFYQIDGGGGEFQPPKPGVAYFHEYEILAQKTFDPQDFARLKKVLSNPASYDTNIFGCFDPGMGFTLDQNGKKLDLVICLKCQGMQVYEQEERIPFKHLSREGCAALMDIYKGYFTEPKK